MQEGGTVSRGQTIPVQIHPTAVVPPPNPSVSAPPAPAVNATHTMTATTTMTTVTMSRCRAGFVKVRIYCSNAVNHIDSSM